MRKILVNPGPVRPSAADLPTILYVEDEEENWDVTEVRLQHRFRLLWARTDREACDIVRNERLAVILMDIQLKGSRLDGIQLTQLLRGNPLPERVVVPEYARNLPRVEIPIVYVTAYGSRYTPEQLRESGGSESVMKPVEFFRLHLALARMRAPPQMAQPAP